MHEADWGFVPEGMRRERQRWGGQRLLAISASPLMLSLGRPVTL